MFTNALLLIGLLAAGGPEKAEKPLRLGIIGLDTSHVVAFTKILNDDKNPDHISGAKVVAAFKGGSPDIAKSADRIEGFTKTLKEDWGIEIVDSIPKLCAKVDAVLLESVDGRRHLEQVKAVFKARKRVFIDKPLAASWKDGVEIARLAKQSGTAFFSASSLRFFPPLLTTKQDPALGGILGCESFGPSPTEPHHPDLFWYGVHGVEGLYTVMGTGCESVTRVGTPDFDMVVGKWKDGRIGSFRASRRGAQQYGVTVYGEKANRSSLSVEGKDGYRNLLVEIIKFFKTGIAPVSADEMIEVLAFMQAADVSKEKGGVPARLDELK